MPLSKALVIFLACFPLPAWAQVDSLSQPAGEGIEDRMVAPTPVGGGSDYLGFGAETPRTNYLRAGLTFNSAYDDGISTGNGQAVNEFSYSIWPSISLKQSRSRVRWDLSYAPGFTFYQNTTSLNQADQNLGLAMEYRLSPHVTLSIRDSFQATSNILNLTGQNAAGVVAGVVQSPNRSIVPAGADQISNAGNVLLTYQFGPNEMVGAKGTFSGLWYPHPSQAQGLFDSITEAAEGFYAYRISGRHYIGVTYDFQRILARPKQAETQTNSGLVFYTIYFDSSRSLSIFAGPQYADTTGPAVLPSHSWSPEAGASLLWQKEHTNFRASYAHRIDEGGGLAGAVQSDTAEASVGWQLGPSTSVAFGASYAINDLLNSTSSPNSNGHTISGTASLQHSLGSHLQLQIGYMRLHQTYADIPAISNVPNRNRAWVSLSYQLDRPLGR